MVPHRGLVNYLHWCTQAYGAAEGRGVPVHSPLSFDLTVTSLFAPLLVGQKLVLVPATQEMEALGEILRTSSDFSFIKLTPAHLTLLNQVIPTEAAEGRTRALIIGGDALWGEAPPSGSIMPVIPGLSMNTALRRPWSAAVFMRCLPALPKRAPCLLAAPSRIRICMCSTSICSPCPSGFRRALHRGHRLGTGLS